MWFLGQSSSRAASQTNVYLESFGYGENQAFDTMSVDSTDSIETSISACSPDNVSRYDDVVVATVSRLFYFTFDLMDEFIMLELICY